jgi:hypothetical protein
MFAALALLMSASVAASQTTRYVPTPDCPTIQAAVDAAVAGDKIRAAAGECRENIVWTNKLLSLIGAGAGLSIVNGDTDNDGVLGPGNCIFINGGGGGSRIEGFTITGGSEAPRKCTPRATYTPTAAGSSSVAATEDR